MMLRIRIIKDKTKITYINLVADENGNIPKYAFPMPKGAKVYATWDTSNGENLTGTLFSFYGQARNFAEMDSIPSLTGYAIMSKEFHSPDVLSGEFQFTITKDNMIMYISCWNQSEYEGATARPAHTAYINFEIRED